MKFFSWFKKLFTRAPAALDKGAKVVETLAPIAAAVAPLTGNPAVSAAASAAGVVAKAVDAAIEDKSPS